MPDPFGATREAVVRLPDEACGTSGRVVEVRDRMAEDGCAAAVIVFQRG